MLQAEEVAPNEPASLSGARADFVATLGRRVTALKSALNELEGERRSTARRDVLLRRMHAMGAAARVLGFDAVADALSVAEKALRRSERGEVAVSDLAEVSRLLDQLPSLAWGAGVALRPVASRPEPEVTGPSGPLSVLVFGAAALGDALDDSEDHPVEVERTEDPKGARDLARSLAPDVIIIDADRRGARELAERLVKDPLIEPVPMIVVGTFELPDAASGYVALGVERVLPKPVNPDTLRRTVLAAARRTSARVATEPLGDVTVDELAARVATEIKRGLVDAMEPGGQSVRVPLGEGTDVLAAVWGAVARVREVVVMRTAGAVRFEASGPEGAVPIAPWTGGDRRAAATRGADDVPLGGRRAVVVDDDPAVVWFMSGLLRSVGMEVFEAHDGATALELTLERWPDIVVSDVLMPGLDGLALCREIKRDIAVRDVPVILLSWKEDLLQRLRELGTNADGYLRKEATGSLVLRRVSEVLRDRARVEARLDAGGEVRGRLDTLTTRLLLDLASRRQPSCKIAVRDAVYLYEVEIRDGQPRCATRTATDGSFERGPRVLGPLLGVSAGRFVVTTSTTPVRPDLSGTLEEALHEPIRRARAAQRALRSETLMRVDRVELDREALAAYLPATPEPAVRLIERLAEGEAPRDLILSGDVSSRLLEAVLSDVIRRGAVVRVLASAEPESAPPPPKSEPPVVSEAEQERLFTFDLGTGVDPDTIDAAWTDSAPNVAPAPMPAPLPLSRTVTPPITELSAEPTLNFESRTKPGVGPAGTVVIAPKPEPKPEPAPEPTPEPVAKPEPPAPMTLRLSRPDPAPALPPPTPPAPEPVVAPPLIETREEPFDDEVLEASDDDVPEHHDDRKDAEEEAMLDQLPAQKRIEFPRERVESAVPKSPPAPAPTPVPVARRVEASAEPEDDRASYRPRSLRGERPMSYWRVALVTVIAAGASFGLVRWVVGPGDAPPEAGTGAAVAPQAPTAAAIVKKPPPEPAQPSLVAEDLELPAGTPIAADKGLLELETGDKHAIYVDGTFVGMGPRRRVPLDPGKHDVKLRLGGDEKTHSVEVKQGRRTRLAAPGAGP